MKEEALALLLVCALAFGGLGYLFASLTSDINQPIAVEPGTERVSVEDAAAPPAATLEDQGWHELAGPSIFASSDGSEFMVNFNTCNPATTTLEFPAGPLVLTLHGLDGNTCGLSYDFDGKSATCEVPASLGALRFSAAGTPNLASIERYCLAA